MHFGHEPAQRAGMILCPLLKANLHYVRVKALCVA